MKISQKSWKSYIDRLSKVNKTAAEKMTHFLNEFPDSTTEDIIEYAYMLSAHYGEAAAELACEMYDEVALASAKIIPPAEPARVATYQEVAVAIQGAMARTQNADAIGAVVGTKVKTVGLDTLLKNSLRDGAEFAWVPSGDTCAFCMMLASNGWQKASKNALKKGHAEHVHNNCDCTYAIRFDHNTEVEGYDPGYYENMYYSADGYRWRDKVNSMRREQYEKDPEKHRAQKRLNYARNKAKEGQIELIKKYGNTEGIMIFGSDEDLQNWAELTKQTGLNDKAIHNIIYKDADNWEGILQKQSHKQLEKFTDQLFDNATEEEIEALRLWTGSAYGNINRFERYGVHVDEISRNAAVNIENILSRMSTPEDLIVKRGTGTKHIFDNMPKGWKEDPSLLVGRTFTDKGFTATSPFEGGGFGGSGLDNAKLFVKVPKGTHGAYIGSIAHNEDEFELLLQKGYSYRIIKAEYRPNSYFPDEKDLKVWVEVIL